MQTHFSFENPSLVQSLDNTGHALLPALLSGDECRQLVALYPQSDRFRSRIVMSRHGFGSGEYQYFRYPLPAQVERLRQRIYPVLAGIANLWNSRLDCQESYPPSLSGFLRQCHRAGQMRPTPLLLQYRPGDYNCLHQDLYGDLSFPLQVAILLSRPGVDFEGGEFCLTEYSSQEHRAEVVPLQQGDGVVFPVAIRPVPGRRGGWRRVQVRHGVSQVSSGNRHTLGVIFHDAR